MELYHDILRLAPWYFPLVATLIGACVGSFLNVCIYRIPKGESVISPRSHCACGQPIAWRDNLPVVSWLLLRGKARCCGRPFSIRYPAIEAVTAGLFLTSWLLFPPDKAAAGAVLSSIVICALFIDVDHMIIPDVFTVGGAAAGLMLSLVFPGLHGQSHDYFVIASVRSGVEAMLGVFVGSGLILWIALFAEVLLKKEAMGFGDVKFLGALGAFVGWKGAIFGMFGGAVLGCCWLVIALLGQRITGRKAAAGLRAETPDGAPAELGLGVHVPFGPMLGVAALLYFFGLHRWVDTYFSDLARLL